jgi:flavin-dependent dehydrogenase
MSAPRVGIIGAGPAGLTAAYRLQQLGADVTV